MHANPVNTRRPCKADAILRYRRERRMMFVVVAGLVVLALIVAGVTVAVGS